jgi:hypothetical protein
MLDVPKVKLKTSSACGCPIRVSQPGLVPVQRTKACITSIHAQHFLRGQELLGAWVPVDAGGWRPFMALMATWIMAKTGPKYFGCHTRTSKRFEEYEMLTSVTNWQMEVS